MAELSAGVRALVARMETNPSEFYGSADKWHFMFSANFREVLTEPEKGALHEALKEVRRKEFDEKVMRELLKDNMEEQLKVGVGGGFGRAQIKGEGMTVGYENESRAALRLGSQTLNEDDVKRFKESSTSASVFK